MSSDLDNNVTQASLAAEVAAEPSDPLLGTVIANRYRVMRKMGEGGMGTVYLAEHVAIEKLVAIKVLLHEYARKAELKERFLQEAKAAAKIGHENIVDITDFGTTPNQSVFFAMEYLDGAELSNVIKKDGAMEWRRAKPILVQICRAMSAAHSKGIVHRDMKPENIFLIEREGRPDFVKVLDFGIAKVSSMGDGERRLTRTGMIFGTPEYMSPEQAQGHLPDHRVDIYALGVIMYEMLTGQVPFKADTFMGILTKHIFETPSRPSEVNPAIGGGVEEIILKAMSKDREHRFHSMSEMCAAVIQAAGPVTRPTGAVPSVRRALTPAPSKVTIDEPLGPPPRLTDRLQTGRGKMIAGLVAVLCTTAFGIFLAARSSRKTVDQSTKTKAAAKLAPQRKPTRTHSTGADRRAPVKQTGPARITVTSNPPGAAILIGGRQLGVTNGEVEIPRSDRPMLLTLRREGYADLALPLVPNRDQTLKGELVAAPKRRRRRRVRRPPDQPTRAISKRAAKTDHSKPAVAVDNDKPATKKEPRSKKKPTFGATPDLMDPFGSQ